MNVLGRNCLWVLFCFFFNVARVKMSVIKKKESKRKKNTRKERKRKKIPENTLIKGPFSHNCITFLCTLHMHKRSP